jgi:hypothetical protein
MTRNPISVAFVTTPIPATPGKRLASVSSALVEEPNLDPLETDVCDSDLQASEPWI